MRDGIAAADRFVFDRFVFGISRQPAPRVVPEPRADDEPVVGVFAPGRFQGVPVVGHGA